jgi:hypothetical protein
MTFKPSTAWLTRPGRLTNYSEFAELNSSIGAKKDGISLSNSLVGNTK